MADGLREELIDNAVNFLKDPKVKDAPLAKRIAFLESKGLTQEEIQAALNSSKLSTPHIPPRPVTKNTGTTWQDISLGILGISGIAYTIFCLAQSYFSAYFDFPTPQKLLKETEEQKQDLSTASKTLITVNNQTSQLIKVMESHALDVAKSLNTCHKTLSSLTESSEKAEKRVHEIEKELESIKEYIPKVSFMFFYVQLLEKTQESQECIVQDLQNEIKSLKKILVSKTSSTSQTVIPSANLSIISEASTSKPSIPEWQLAGSKVKPSSPAKEANNETKDAISVECMDP